MTFANIPHGSQVFLDANTLVYYFTADPRYGAACKHLVERIARREIQGATSAHALADVVHRVMTLEAIMQFGWPDKGIAQRLRKNPAEVQKLTRFGLLVQETSTLGIRVLPIDLNLVTAGTVLTKQYGLLTGDALIVATMQAHGLTHVASADPDFDRVPTITRYAPA